MPARYTHTQHNMDEEGEEGEEMPCRSLDDSIYHPSSSSAHSERGSEAAAAASARALICSRSKGGRKRDVVVAVVVVVGCLIFTAPFLFSVPGSHLAISLSLRRVLSRLFALCGVGWGVPPLLCPTLSCSLPLSPHLGPFDDPPVSSLP